MKINHKLSSILFGMALICSSQAVFASGLSDLNPEQQAKVKNGQQVSIRVPQGDQYPWPQFQSYQRVDATPEEAAAVFADYAKHKDYFKSVGITKSDAVAVDAVTAKVSYSFTFPMGLGSDNYTVEDKLSGDFSKGKFQVDWKVLQSDNSYIGSHGTAYFEPMDNGNGTIITYVNFIHPKERRMVDMKWAWIVDGAEKAQNDTASALVKSIQEIRINDNATLKEQVEKLKKALSH